VREEEREREREEAANIQPISSWRRKYEIPRSRLAGHMGHRRGYRIRERERERYATAV